MESKGYFEEVAPQWDIMRSSYFSDAVRKKVAAQANVRPGTTALDMGAGTGFITEELLGRGLHVIAVDQSPAMLDELRRKFGETGLIECRIGEAGAIPAEPNSVDFVFANMYLHHVEDPAQAIQELARVLAPGGVLVITDLDAHQFEFLRTEQMDRWMGFVRMDIARWLVDAGLENVRVDCLNERCCASSTTACSGSARSVRAEISIFIATAQKRHIS